jgi:NAD(P)-dependent dehydrogenase (short-subunit alcohol dehydrogenase family)
VAAPADPTPPLPHRRIVITGASSGIGHRLALRLVAAGHEVWGLARRSPDSEAPFRSSRCDVSDYESVAAAAREIGAAWPEIDALICCAGVQGAIGPAMTLDPAEWSRTVRTNLDGAFYTLRAFFPLLHPSGGGRAKVMCFSGGGATTPRLNFSAYAAAKTGLVRLVETLAHEWQDLPLDINAIAPGALPTRLTEEILAFGPEGAGAEEYAAARQTATTGAARFERVEALVDYLLHPVSDGITGRLLSAPWDPWPTLHEHREELAASDIFTLRRIVPADRQKRL